MGTPIFLLRNDGGKIPLMATTLTMNVDRNVVALPMPMAGGSRFAFDLNLPKSLITIEGVMTDDDLLNIGDVARSSSCVIDFAATNMDGITRLGWIYSDNTNAIIAGHALNAIADADYAIRINFIHDIWFVRHNTLNYGYDSGSDRYFVTINNGTSNKTPSEVATYFNTLINTYSSTFNMTSTIISSPTYANFTTSAVQLVKTIPGSNGNFGPTFPKWPNAFPLKPYHTQFFGGTNSSAVDNKSAGDKVAELFGILNNSNNGGGGAIFNPDAWLRKLNELGDIRENQQLDSKYGDYIIGIQIPFKSNVNNNSSLFYMPTGGLMEIYDKTADNAKPVGTKYQGIGDEYGAIKGAIANATFVQLGGEPLYSYTINFIPIDWIF